MNNFKPVPAQIQTSIQNAYRELMAQGAKRRKGQQIAIGQIASAIANCKHEGEASTGANLLAIQAPTGSGKTYAYGLGAIPVALAAGLKVIISTATVQLQEQVMSKDIVALSSVIPDLKPVLVKGRARYACPTRVNAVAQGEGEGKDAAVREVAVTLRAKLATGWSGDVDDLSDQPGKEWSAFTTDSNGCRGKKCSQYNACPFQNARKAIDGANTLVVNHSILISDLANGNFILPKIQNCALIVDEAHDFPSVALASLEGKSPLEEGQKLLLKANRVVSSLCMTVKGGALNDICNRASGALNMMAACMNEAKLAIHATGQTTDVRDTKKAVRFAMGTLPEWLGNVAQSCKTAAEDSQTVLNELIELLSDEESSYLSEKAQEQFLSELSKAAAHLNTIVTVWRLMAATSHGGLPVAKWLEIDENRDDLHICASPVGVGEFLHELIWSQCAAAVHLSATLTTVGGFTQYLNESGLSLTKGVRTLDVESPFNYQEQAAISIPAGIANPKNSEEHTQSVIRLVKRVLLSHPQGEGALMVFSSWKQLREVRDAMPQAIKDCLLVQGDGLSKRELIAKHKATVDAGFKSVIFGVASMEQGVDLAHRYVTLVIIAKLQFAVPDEPVAMAHDEWMRSVGRSYFEEIVLPETARRLAQTAGRLIRSETDTGRIIVTDPRLTQTGYGRKMLASLPDYRREINWSPEQTGIQGVPW